MESLNQERMEGLETVLPGAVAKVEQLEGLISRMEEFKCHYLAEVKSITKGNCAFTLHTLMLCRMRESRKDVSGSRAPISRPSDRM